MNEEERRPSDEELSSDASSEQDVQLSPAEVSETDSCLPAEKKASRLQLITEGVFEYLEPFLWVLFAALILVTFVFRLCVVDGESMENTLHDKEMLLAFSLGYAPKQDDIVVFHTSDNTTEEKKILVKRVIATSGQTVVIDTKNRTITVDGVVYADTHSILKDASDTEIGYYYTSLFGHNFDPKTGIFSATVPENCVFLLGDNRNNSKDSRNRTVGFIDERQILGKVVIRLAPFTVFS